MLCFYAHIRRGGCFDRRPVGTTNIAELFDLLLDHLALAWEERSEHPKKRRIGESIRPEMVRLEYQFRVSCGTREHGRKAGPDTLSTHMGEFTGHLR
jgi:hypothetical protein